MERPILFSGAMVRALLDGRKTQTRRVVKLPHMNPLGQWEPTTIGGPNGGCTKSGETIPEHVAVWHTRTGDIVCAPYGVPGDRLWVREAWAAEDALDDLAPRSIPPGGPIWYAADNSLRGLRGILHMGKNRPGMFMPRWASRLTLEVVSVRVERLNEISEADARAEGMDADVANSPRVWYMALWHAINAKRAPWASNPWVWAITFRRVT